jgi:hypothetical protein
MRDQTMSDDRVRRMRQSANRICILILNGMQQGSDDEYPETHDCYAAASHGDGYVAKVLKIAEQIYRSEVE